MEYTISLFGLLNLLDSSDLLVFPFNLGRPAWVDVQMAQRLKIPHTFVIHTYTKPTKCHFCNKMLVGVYKQVEYVSGSGVYLL